MKAVLPASLLLLATSCTFCTPCLAKVVYVSTYAPSPIAPAWGDAYNTLQEAINAASPGDEVWVAKGTYSTLSTVNGTFLLPSSVALYGGFAGTETARGQRDVVNNVTILDGAQRYRVLTIADNAASNTIVDGFTIQNGYDVDYTNQRPGAGGGVYIGGGSPTVSNNVITGNGTGGSRNVGSVGGGIYVGSGTPLIQGNTISNNGAIYGGGIYALGGTIRDNLIANNVAQAGYAGTGTGGGINMGPSVVVVHNMLVGNTQYGSYGGGGGIACNGGTVTDNLFMDNTGDVGRALDCVGNTTILRNAFLYSITQPGTDVYFDGGTFSNNLLVSDYGGGLLLGRGAGNANGSQPLLANNTFCYSGAYRAGVEAILSAYRNGEHPVLSNNIFYGWGIPAIQSSGSPDNPPVFTTDHNDVYGNVSSMFSVNGASQVGQNGNIGANPLFVNANGGDFHLLQNSPCINTGNEAYVTAGDTDLDGKTRILGSHVDIGAYEAASITPATFQQALRALRLAAGLNMASSADETQLNVETAGTSSGKVDMADAVHLLRSADGLGS